MDKHSTYDSGQGIFNSVLSFKPLLAAWEEIIKEGREGARIHYQELLDKVKSYPDLLEPITDHSILKQHRLLIEQMMATLFPITLSDKEDLFSVSVPFTYHAIYSSQYFKSLFLNEDGNFIQVPDETTEKRIHEEKKAGAYQLILKKFYGINLSGKISSIHPFKCPFTALDKYLELEVDARFIDVKTKLELPSVPANYCCSRVNDILHTPEIMQWLPLEQFTFEGIAIIHIREVTDREVINNIKNSLLTLHSFADVETYKKLQKQIENLVGIPGVKTGITPFFKLNNHFVFSKSHNANSFFLKNIPSNEEKKAFSESLQQHFSEHKEVLAIPEISPKTLERYSFLKYLDPQKWKGIIICPLNKNGQLIGILEIVTEKANKLDSAIVIKIEPAIPLFELALEKSAENLESQIDKIIKDQFTAVQSYVEWRFNEAALNYLTKTEQDEDTKIESITFDNVHPLYGAIDIRNSSTERNLAIQKDLLEQLKMAATIIKKAKKETKYPLLDEILFKIRKYSHSVSNIILSDDEISINNFLNEEIVQLFRHLNNLIPSLKEDISQYFAAVNSNVGMLYHHRKEYDESITNINKTVAKFIDKEQALAQQIYPHYFERFVTDGVDFNIYIGQSITPNIPYDDFYLKNIKIWQLTTLAKAARLTKSLENKIAIPLQTTQLILAHSNQLSISFRTAERKFDVDGAYNIRYEIIKKRIDKVRIKDSNDRLTQPGSLAIVYAQQKEATEYIEYIEYLQSEGLLKGEIERFDLEELQGVSGLKALRVSVNLEEQPIATEAKKLDKIVSAFTSPAN